MVLTLLTGGTAPNISIGSGIPLTGDVGGTHLATVLAPVTTAATYTNPINVTVDAKGRVISANPGPSPVISVSASDPIFSSGGVSPVLTLGPVNLSGDVTGTTAATQLPLVSSPGVYSNIATITLDGKGRTTLITSGAPSVTSVTATSPLSATPGTTPVISLDDTTVIPGNYSNANITVDQKGRLTLATNGSGATTTLTGDVIGGPSVGTVATTYNSVVPVNKGGTNSSTALSGQSIVVSNGTQIVQGAAGTTTTVLHGNAAGAPSYSAVALATDVSGTLPVANGGTNSTTALSGQSIMISNGTQVVQGAAGTTSTVLHGNASGAPTYGQVALGSEVSGTLPVANGGTGATTHTANNLLAGNGTSAIISTGVTYTANTLTFPAATTVATTTGAISYTADVNLNGALNTTGSSSRMTFNGPPSSYAYGAELVVDANDKVITPTNRVHVVNRTAGNVATINLPYAGFTGAVTFMLTNNCVFNTNGNISRAQNGTAGAHVTFYYNPVTSKWFGNIN